MEAGASRRVRQDLDEVAHEMNTAPRVFSGTHYRRAVAVYRLWRVRTITTGPPAERSTTYDLGLMSGPRTYRRRGS